MRNLKNLAQAIYPLHVMVVLIGVVGLYSLIWFTSQQKLIYTDEVVFTRDFVRISQGDWSHIEIPHPPLYTGLGALAIKIWGYNLPAMRLLGALAFVITLGLIPLACYAVLPDRTRGQRAAVIALIIYGLHPLALQGSLLLDVDNTIFTPAMVLFIIILSLTEAWPVYQRGLVVGLVFALMLWTKLLPTALLLTLSVLLIYAWRPRLWVTTLGGLAFGLFLFGLTFYLFKILVDFPAAVLLATFMRTQEPISGGLPKLLSRTLMGGGISLVWFGIPFVLLYGLVVARRSLTIFRTRQVIFLDSLIACSLGGFVLYSIGNELPMGFPRYHYPLLVLMVLLVSHYLAGLNLKKLANPYLWLVTAILGSAYFLLVYPDPLLPQYQLTFETNNLGERLFFGLRLQLFTFVIPFALLWAIFWLKQRNYFQAFLAACIMFALTSWGVLTFTQARANYATIYEYGRYGGAEISAIVQQRTQPTDTLIAPLEIIFAARRDGQFLLKYTCPTCEAQKWLEQFQTQPPAVYVLTTKEDGRYQQVTRDPRVVALLDRCYTDRLTVGSYLAYFRTSLACK